MAQINFPTVYKKLYREFGPQGWWPVIGKGKSQNAKGKTGGTCYEIMVGAILTQNTAWTNVEKAIRNLIAARAMDPQKMVRMSSARLERLIRPAGYFRQKAKKLKIFSKWYLSVCSGDAKRLFRIPTSDLRLQLLALWGIGPETADSILLYAFGRPVFVIDAYTRRLCEAFKMVPGSRRLQPASFRKAAPAKAGGYHELQKTFTDALPRSTKLYNEFHALIVAWGKKHARRNS